MPSVESSAKPVDQDQQSSSRQEQPHQQQNGQVSNGALSEEPAPMVLDPDRQLIPADRIEHVEDAEAPIELPTVREFSQNDKINKFLLNSFLQRINDANLDQDRDSEANGDGQVDPEQDFEA